MLGLNLLGKYERSVCLWNSMDFIIVRQPDTMGLENSRLTVSNKPEL
jgi:hypothetical protein